MTDVGIQVESRLDPVQADLVACLEVREAMVKRLHKQNEDQRKEIATLKAASANAASSNKGARSRDNNNSHHSRGSPTSTTQEQAPQKFPPLQSQSYWHRRVPRYRLNLNTCYIFPHFRIYNLDYDDYDSVGMEEIDTINKITSRKWIRPYYRNFKTEASSRIR